MVGEDANEDTAVQPHWLRQVFSPLVDLWTSIRVDSEARVQGRKLGSLVNKRVLNSGDKFESTEP